MAITFGSARIDENGRISGGKAGDQTGREITTQAYYNHSKGWRAFRCPDSTKAAKIAAAMLAACNNNNIGYDQFQRNTLYNVAQKAGFNPAAVNTPCETDCSALVRVCLCYAGYNCPDVNTASLPRTLLNLGLQEIKFTLSNGSGLKTGDILVTKTKGHTVIVTSGSTAAVVHTENKQKGAIMVELHEQSKGSKGNEVKTLQRILYALNYNLGGAGIDGDFGAKTEAAVKAFQTANGLVVDGIVGKNTWNKLILG